MKLYQKALTYVTLGAVSIGVGLGFLGCTTKSKVDNLEQKTEQTESEKKEVNYISGKVKSEHTTVTGSCGTNYWIYSFSLETEDKKDIIFRCVRDQPNDITYIDDRLDVGDKVKVRLTSSQLKPKILEDLEGKCIYDNISLDQVLEVNGEKFESGIGSEKKEVNYISGKITLELTVVTELCGTNYFIYSFSLKTEDKKDIIFRCVRDKESESDIDYLDDRLDVDDKVKIRLTSSQLKPKILEDLKGACIYDNISLDQIVEINGEKFE